MILLELPGSIDWMSLITMGSAQYVHANSSIPFEEQMKHGDKMTLAGSLFCGITIHTFEVYKHEGYLMSPTILSINEDNIRDGVYEYIVKDPDHKATAPIPDEKPENGFMIYGSINKDNMFIEAWFNGTMISKLMVLPQDNGPAIIKPEDIDMTKITDSEIINAINTVSAGAMNTITQRTIAMLSGYKKGQEAAKRDPEEFIDGDE
jgi:hypothetical protein